MYTLEVVTPPASEPVTLAELKAHLRLNTSAEDAPLTEMIQAAREVWEQRTNRTLLPTAYRQWTYQFYRPIYLVRGAVSSVSAVKFYDSAGTLQTLDTSLYIVDKTGTPTTIYFPNGVGQNVNYVKRPVASVEFTAGYANAAAVPASIKLALKLLAGHWYERREAWVEKSLTEVPQGFRSVCDLYQTGMIGDAMADARTGISPTLNYFFGGGYYGGPNY